MAEKNSIFDVTQVIASREPGVFVPRTALGMKLAYLRNRAITSGMRLLTEDEVLEEVKRRRGELNVVSK